PTVLDCVCADSQRHFVPHLVHSDGAALWKAACTAEADFILRGGAQHQNFCRTTQRVLVVTGWDTPFVEEKPCPRVAEAHLVNESVAEIAHPVQADLLVERGDFLEISYINSKAEIYAVV